MKKVKKSKSQFVVCINNSDYPASLELNKIYQVLNDKEATEDGDIRIIDESGEDYLYPLNYFLPISIYSELEEAILRIAS